MVAPFGVTILKYTVTISTFHFYLTINTRTFPSFNIIFNRLHKTLVWEKRQNGMWAQEIIRYRIWEHSLLVRDGSGYQVDILFSLALFQETRPALSVDTSLYHSLISRWFQSVLCLMPFSQTRRILPRRFCL